eukprot:m.77431 g.77431  ORF g.77431 m.77431 type:complete len:600 (-) comp16201_c0_seq2:827-2626(-)
MLMSSLGSACSPALERELGLDLMPSVLDDIDAIYRYGSGVFVRKQGDTILNPFHECVQVINTVRNVAKFFAFQPAKDARTAALRACCEKHHIEFIPLPRQSYVDQIASVHTLLWKLICMETPLTQFLTFCKTSETYVELIDCRFSPVFEALNGTFFQYVREIEAVLHILMFRKDRRGNVPADAEVIVGGFGAVLMHDVLTSLRNTDIFVLATDSSKSVERTACRTGATGQNGSGATHLSPMGNRLLLRCLTEAERQFCHGRAAGVLPETSPHDTDIAAIKLSCDYGQDAPIDLPGRMNDELWQPAREKPSAKYPTLLYSKHTVFALLLDLRLCASKTVADMLPNHDEAIKALGDKYVEFAMAATKHDEAVAVKDSVLHTATSPVQASCTPSTSSASVHKWSAKSSTFVPENAPCTQAGNDTEVLKSAHRIDFKRYYHNWQKLGVKVLKSTVEFAKRRIETYRANGQGYCHGIPAHEKHGTGMLREMMAFDASEQYVNASSTLFGFMPRMAYCYVGECLSRAFTSQALSDVDEIATTMKRTGFNSDSLRKQVIIRQNRDFVCAWTHAGDTQGCESDSSTNALSSAHTGPAHAPSSASGSG